MAARRRRAAKRRTSKRKGGNFGGLKIRPDAALGKVLGAGAVSPAQMTKKLWVYIKKHSLLKR